MDTEHKINQEYYKRLQEENNILKDILTGATLTVSGVSTDGENRTNEIFLSNLLKRHTPPSSSSSYITSSTETPSLKDYSKTTCDNRPHNEKSSTHPSNTNASGSFNEDTLISSSSSTSFPSAQDGEVKKDTPRYYKQDLLSILQERNEIKEERDNLLEELEEWKRAAIESQELVNKLESDLAIAQGKLGGYAFATEIEANALGILPKGTEFRPKTMTEVMDIYVTDVERVGFKEQHGKFVFSIQLLWSNKRRFEIYRGYGEFFTFQNTLLLLFPEEAGKQKSERIIPSLPTADNVLAILGATNKKSIVESRLQLISDYCIGLLNLPKKISRSVFVKDFFRAKPGDTQLESLERPKQHNLELSVYPLIPEGQSLGVYIAVSDFTPSDKSKNQIPLKEGETVKVVKEDKSGWWFVYQQDGDKCGYVPSSFLSKIGNGPPNIASPVDTRDILGFIGSLDHRNIHDIHTETHSIETHTHSTETETHSTPLVSMMCEYVAVDSYQTNDSRQLSFPEGAVLTIIEKSEDGWWFATYDNQGGWVPSTYLITLSQYNDLDFNTNNIDQSLTATLFVGQPYVTIQSYTAQEEDELSLPVGVKVAVTEKSLNGWWQVRYKKKTGYVPAVILRAQTDIDEEEERHRDSSAIPSPLHHAITSLTNHAALSHSVSGIRKPPPRTRKKQQLLETIAIERKRTSTQMEPVTEEVEEIPVGGGDGGSTADRKRKPSIKEWFQNFRRKTVSDAQDKPSIEEEEERVIQVMRNNTFSTVDKHQPRLRSAHIVGSISMRNGEIVDSID